MGITDFHTFLIGALAATLTTISFIPQVVRIIKIKETKDISLAMYSLFSLGIFLWLVYGILLNQLPIIVANAITLVLCMMILYFKLKYK